MRQFVCFRACTKLGHASDVRWMTALAPEGGTRSAI
jgi:hypothetical protein